MTPADVLLDGISRISPVFEAAVDGLSADALTWSPGPGANPIAWLAWHSGRVIDAQVAELDGQPEEWITQGWHERFALPLPADAMGYGMTGYAMSPGDAARVVATPELLTGYLADAVARMGTYVRGLRPGDLDEIIDRRWDPPVTRGVRLVSIVDDCAQHAGQAAYLRGLLDRR